MSHEKIAHRRVRTWLWVSGGLLIVVLVGSVYYKFPSWVYGQTSVGPSNIQVGIHSLGESAQSYINGISELVLLDPVFSVNHGEVYFSAAKENRFQVHRFDLVTRQAKPWSDQISNRDHFYPVMFAEKLLALQDTLGDQQYSVVGSVPRELSSLKGIKRLITSPTGEWLLAFGTRFAHCFQARDKTIIRCGSIAFDGDYMGHSFSPDSRFVVIATTKSLNGWTLGSGEGYQFESLPNGEKGGVAFEVETGALYLSAEGADGFKDIYRLEIQINESRIVPNKKPELVYSSRGDKSQFQIIGRDLYFVENKNTEYLLKRLNLDSKRIEKLTRRGVVYRYALIGSEILATYSDIETPLTLVLIDPDGESSPEPLLLQKGKFQVPQPEWTKPVSLSSGWVFRPKGALKGAVLTIHGGPSICVSPRWDPIYQLWLEMGYLVVAPNYPGSRGFGARFMKMSRRESLEDLNGWLAWLRSQVFGKPLFIDGLSYGGVLGQELAVQKSVEVSGLILRSSALHLSPEQISSLSPILVLFGERDHLVASKEVQDSLSRWVIAAPGRVFYRGYLREGHLLREISSLRDSFSTVASFMEKAQ